MNGAIRWTAFEKKKPLDIQNWILLFDLSTEVFKKMKMPQELVGECPLSLSVSIFGGSLSVIHLVLDEEIKCCNIWVKSEYGVFNSWNKMWTVHVEGGLERPLGLRNNGDILLVLKNGELVSYDPKSGDAKNLEIRGSFTAFWACTYSESLVLINKECGAVSKPVKKRCDKSKLGKKSDANVSNDEGGSILLNCDEIDSSDEEDKQAGRDPDREMEVMKKYN